MAHHTLMHWSQVLLGNHGPLARYVKLRVAHVPGMPGTFSSLPRVSDHDKHHSTCVTHVPWCMPGSLISGFLWSRCWGNLSRRMHNPQFYVSGKRPITPHDGWAPCAGGDVSIIFTHASKGIFYLQQRFHTIYIHNCATYTLLCFTCYLYDIMKCFARNDEIKLIIDCADKNICFILMMMGCTRIRDIVNRTFCLTQCLPWEVHVNIWRILRRLFPAYLVHVLSKFYKINPALDNGLASLSH